MIRPLMLALALVTVPKMGTPDSTPPVHPRYVVIDDQVRAQFAADWDETNPAQHERAYCLAYVISSRWGVPVYRVWAASRADVYESTPTSITYRCPRGPGIATGHSHPPSTEDENGVYHFGGGDAWECVPSPLDEWTLQASGDPFGLILCDKHAAVGYFPHPVR